MPISFTQQQQAVLPAGKQAQKCATPKISSSSSSTASTTKMAHLLFSLQHSSSRLTDYELIPCREEHECISRRGLHITHSDIPMHICFTKVCYVPWLHLKAGCWLARLYKNLSCLLQEGSYHIMKEKLGTCHESFLPSSLLDYFCYQKIHISTTRNSWEAQHTNADEIVLANFVRISKECA